MVASVGRVRFARFVALAAVLDVVVVDVLELVYPARATWVPDSSMDMCISGICTLSRTQTPVQMCQTLIVSRDLCID